MPFDASDSGVPVFKAQATPHDITLEATHGSVKVVLFSGVPLNQPVHWRGPMALASADALWKPDIRLPTWGVRVGSTPSGRLSGPNQGAHCPINSARRNK